MSTELNPSSSSEPNQVQTSETETTKPQFVTSEDLDKKFAEITEVLNKTVNGFAKKLEKKLEDKPAPTPEKELTIDTLKSEYESKLKELQEKSESELAAFKAQLEAKDRSEFASKVRSKIATTFAGKGFDDVNAALEVFQSLHPENNFQPGSDGYVIYKAGDKSETLEQLIDNWSSSAIGKRFLPAPPIANGSGSKEKQPKTTATVKDDAKKSRVQKLLDSKKFTQ